MHVDAWFCVFCVALPRSVARVLCGGARARARVLCSVRVRLLFARSSCGVWCVDVGVHAWGEWCCCARWLVFILRTYYNTLPPRPLRERVVLSAQA